MSVTTKRRPSHWKTTQGGLRPPRYSTPPPLDRKRYVEPISPTSALTFTAGAEPTQDHTNWNNSHHDASDAQGLGLSFNYAHSTNYEVARNGPQPGQSPTLVSSVEWSPYLRNAQLAGGQREFSPAAGSPEIASRHKGHNRSGSTIDTLATVALATSPTFAHTTPVDHGTWSRVHTPRRRSDIDEAENERPAKRAKSEKLPSPIFLRKDFRPATSHVASYDSTMRNDAELLLNLARPALNNSHWAPFTNAKSATTPLHSTEPEQPPHSPLTPPPPPIFPASSPLHISPGPDIHQALRSPIETETLRPPALDEGNFTADQHSDQMDTAHAPLADEPVKEEQDTEINQREVEEGAKGHMTSSLASKEQTEVEAATTKMELGPEHPSKEAKSRKKDDSKESICSKCNQIHLMVDGISQGPTEDWIECSACKNWYHCVCVDLQDEREVQSIDKFICAGCEPTHGPTTHVRKSSRARTMIDYAGLNEGIVQASTETHEHLYSKALREGKLTCMPDNFARIRPELATIDHLEGMTGGWNRPVVIPAKWNPRTVRHAESLTITERFDRDHSPPLEAFKEIDLEDDDYMSDREYEEVIDVDQDCLDMVIPHGLTVPIVSELIGPEEKVVDVIDVKTQNGENKKWSMQRWTDYYERKDPNKQIRNVISLEVSKYKLGRLIRRPKVVRDMDILDHVWPQELEAQFPAVQFYCLMSVADCYTDFHVDFGGSSVYYHIVKGKKTFFFVPPEEKNIRQYEDWCNSGQQHADFLGDLCTECRRVDLSEGDTMLIPAGWIHAVWTPEDSLVIGGNFLTRTNYELQFRIWESEKRCKIEQKFRYPHFQKVMWFAAIKYMADDPVPDSVLQAFQSDSKFQFERDTPIWWELGKEPTAEAGSPQYNARWYSKKEITGLNSLREFLRRTTLIAAGHPVEGVTVKSRDAVRRSMPKGYGDPAQLIRVFAIWCAWKAGNVVAPEWVYQSDQPPLQSTVAALVKKKKPEPPRVPPERQSARVQELAQAQADAQAQAEAEAEEQAQADSQAQALAEAAAKVAAQAQAQAQLIVAQSTPTQVLQLSGSDGDIPEESTLKKARTTPKSSGLGPKRVACDACRKRRIKCRHKEEHQMDPDTTNHSIEVAQAGFGYDSIGTANSSYRQDLTSSYGELTPLNAYDVQGTAANPDFSTPTAKKPGRTKACDECRKSKRRCVHDENGKIDPIKLQEPSKPRGSSSAKRPRPSDEMPAKKAKRPSTARDITPAEAILVGQAQSALAQATISSTDGFTDDMIDPALMQMGQPEAQDSGYYPATADDFTHVPDDNVTNQAIAALALQAQGQDQVDISAMLDPRMFSSSKDPGVADDHHAHPQDAAATPAQGQQQSFASPPSSLDNEAVTKRDKGVHEGASEIRNSIEAGHDLVDPNLSLGTPKSTSRGSSDQPRFTNTTANISVPTPRQRRESAGSSEGTKSDHTAQTVFTNATDTHHPSSSHATSPMTAPRGRSSSVKGRPSVGEIDADEESMKLIRELQAQDLGLRRRG